ncbi:MAG: DUF11 domain-containing protein [Campylobacterales bacterium]|nr:DUF11 domain-containing protein [Campylobacterales bacterium]
MKSIHLFKTILLLILFTSSIYSQTILNIATASFEIDGSVETVRSNEVNITTLVQNTTIKQEYNIWLEKSVNKQVASIREIVEYEITVHNEEDRDINNLTLIDQMPRGLKYKPNTFRVDAVSQNPTLSNDGLQLTCPIDTLAAKSSMSFKFIAIIGAGAASNTLTNRVFINSDAMQISNTAAATTILVEELMRSKGIIIGEVTNTRGKGVQGVRLYMQDGRYVVTDRNGKYHFENVDTGNNVVQVDIDLLPDGYEMDRCSDQNSINSAFSRFVDMGKGALKRANFCLKQGTNRTNPNRINFHIPNPTQNMPKYSKYNLQNIPSTPQIIWPPKNHVPAIPSTSIAFSYPKDHKATLWLNDQQVSMLNFDGKTKDNNLSMVIDRYKGVDLLDDLNIIKVEIFDGNGTLVQTLTQEINVASTPVSAEYIEKSSYAVADGINSPVIAVKFLDNNGQPIRAGITSTFSVEAPHTTQSAIDAITANPLSNNTSSSDRYVVGADGIAYIKLQPTTTSGEVVLHFDFNGRQESVKAWLKPKMRDWIVVGVADGTVAYNRTKTKTTTSEYKVEKKGQVSLFAKGKLSDNWLLTLAYNSGKDPNTPLFNEIDPNTYYTLYNDATRAAYEAASRKKLFAKLESNNFYVMYGDYNSDLTYTKLSKYSRNMTGIKSEYHSKHLEAKGFVSKSDQAFIKDEMQGNGSSGYYILTNKMLIENSETITIEVRDRYQSQKIISTRTLQRYRDYNIDYNLGRIYFKEPIYSMDENFNPRYIIADYEIDGEGGEYYTYGGRAALKAFENRLEVGATYINEDNAKNKNTLMGVDTTIKIGNGTRIKAEYAKTKNSTEGKKVEGDAKLVELEHISKGLYILGYYREQDSSFGLGQLNGSLGGTRKIEVEFNKLFSNRFKIEGNGYRDTNLLDNTHQDVLDLKMGIEKTLWSSYVGYRYAKNSERIAVNQILFGLSRSFFDQKLRLSLNYDYSLNENDDDILYPTKTLIGAEYALSNKVNLFANYEISKRENKKYELGQVGVRYMPWSGMSITNRTLSEFYNDTQRVYNTIGLKQNFQLNQNINLNFGYEEAKVARGEWVENNISNQSEPFQAYNFGINYHNKKITATLNGEYRDGIKDRRTNLTLGVYSAANDDFALAYSGGFNLVEAHELIQRDLNMKLLFAYRPNGSKFVMFDKLEYIYAKYDEAGSVTTTEKLVNNLNLNYMPNDNLELALQYGVKYVIDSIETFDHKGITHLVGLDTTLALSDRWDVGVQSSMLYAKSADNYDYNLGAYIGYNLFEDAWLMLGYNIEGFEDEDFALQNYRKEGAYVQFKMKFNQKDLKSALKVLSW